MERYINVNDITLKGVAVFDENLDLIIPLSDVRKALQLAPTADVVPKSEVEKIFEEIEKIRLEFLTEKITGADMAVKLFLLKKKYTEE